MSLKLLKLRDFGKNLESKISIPDKVGSHTKAHWLLLRIQNQMTNQYKEKIKCKKNISRVILNEFNLGYFKSSFSQSKLKLLKQFTCVSTFVILKKLKLIEKLLSFNLYLRKLHLDIKLDQHFVFENSFKTKKFKLLDSLDIRFYRINNSQIFKFFKSFSSMNKLKKFDLHLFLDKDPIDKGLRKLPNYFSRLDKKIESVTLQISSNSDLNINLSQFFKGLSFLETLKKIKLQFQTPLKSNLNDVQMSNFLTSLRADKLETFIIYLPQSQRITDQTLFRFGDCFYNLRCIKSLQLKFSSDEITDAGVWKLNSLMNLEGLINLQIGFVGCENVSNASVRSLFRSIEKLLNLKSLSFNFMNSKISEKSLKDLHMCFGKSNIETFNLCVRNCKNLDHHLNFITSLTGIQLKTFSFDGSQNQIILKRLGGFIKCLINLEELSLSLSKSNLSDCDFIDLFECFQSLTKVRKLNLSLDDNPISNVTLYSLVQALYPLHFLTDYYLNVRGCSKLTSEAFIELGVVLKKVSNLNILRLAFNSCILFDSLTLARYGELFSELINLERFELNLDGCSKINDEGIIILSQNLKKLPKLKQVDIKTAKTKSLYIRIENLEDFKN